MGRADTLHIPYVGIIGGDELAHGTVTVKDMTTGEQSELTVDEIINKLSK